MAQEKQDLFTPDLDTDRRYKDQITILLESRGSKYETIDMGRLPEIYTVLGISDKQLKTNGKTLLKALGIEGRNKHNVPKETIKNLLYLTYDPEAVFKSLSTSDNPNAFIAVLNAKTEKQEQIIAILSPSRDGHGFTFIPSVYEKQNFDRFLGRIMDEQKILYIKNEGSELWGQLQSLPRHNQEPSLSNISTKNDIVKHFNENSLIKEKTMPNEPNEPNEQGYDPEKVIDWNKKLGEQSDYVKKAIEPLLTWKFAYTKECMDIGNYNGNDDYKQFWETKNKEEPNFVKEHILENFSVGSLYDHLSGYGDDEKPAVERLKSIGIDGMRFNGKVTVYDDSYLKSIDREQHQEQAEHNTEFNRKDEERQAVGLALETAQKTGYVQGVCECVAIVSGQDQNMGKKLLSEMNVTRDIAKKFANPETYKTLENGIFAQQQEQTQTHGIKR
jgi:hypothetical protein